MSVSKQRRLGPTPADVEFKAMERMIEILPLVRLPLVEGLDGVSHAAQYIAVHGCSGGRRVGKSASQRVNAHNYAY